MKTARKPKSPYYRKARKTPFDLAHPVRFHQAYTACEMYTRKNFQMDYYYRLQLTLLRYRLRRFVWYSKRHQAILVTSMQKFANNISAKRRQIEKLGLLYRPLIAQNNKMNR